MQAIAKTMAWLNMITGTWVALWQSGRLEDIKLCNFYD